MADDTAAALAQLLSEGLDLCVRARKLDDAVKEAEIEAWKASAGGELTRCGTPALWIMDHYDRDLADWEQRARKGLLQSGLVERVKRRP